jgi:dipeptidyl aminopeptidase/acylaminoacyl peptidase
MTNYIATHSKRFKAYITQRSVVNDLIGYASSDLQGESNKYPGFEEFMTDSLKSSVISYVERINAPFLILHGMEDFRTPVEGAHQLFVALKDLHPDLPVKLVLYPHVGHNQPSHPKQAMHYYQEMLDWFGRYL